LPAEEGPAQECPGVVRRLHPGRAAAILGAGVRTGKLTVKPLKEGAGFERLGGGRISRSC
jgi:hypothetical protein